MEVFLYIYFVISSRQKFHEQFIHFRERWDFEMVIVPRERSLTAGRTNTLLSIFRMELDIKERRRRSRKRKAKRKREEALLTRVKATRGRGFSLDKWMNTGHGCSWKS